MVWQSGLIVAVAISPMAAMGFGRRLMLLSIFFMAAKHSFVVALMEQTGGGGWPLAAPRCRKDMGLQIQRGPM